MGFDTCKERPTSPWSCRLPRRRTASNTTRREGDPFFPSDIEPVIHRAPGCGSSRLPRRWNGVFPLLIEEGARYRLCADFDGQLALGIVDAWTCTMSEVTLDQTLRQAKRRCSKGAQRPHLQVSSPCHAVEASHVERRHHARGPVNNSLSLFTEEEWDVVIWGAAGVLANMFVTPPGQVACLLRKRPWIQQRYILIRLCRLTIKRRSTSRFGTSKSSPQMASSCSFSKKYTLVPSPRT